MDCTFCLDCVQACPHDNVGVISRLPASELVVDPPRSGIGFFSRRKDLAALVIVFTFGALLNAFGMVSPIYALQNQLASLLRLNHEAPVLGMIFMLFLIVEPILLLGLAAWLTRKFGGSKSAISPGLFTFIPVFQSAAASVGRPLLGEPRWDLGGLPENVVYPMELGFLGLGLAGSLMVIYRLAEEDCASSPVKAFAPWAVLCALLWLSAIWLMSQPMEMRGTFLAG
jgi:hypothetical protein